MKILHVSHLYYPSMGGNQIHVRELSEKLVAFNENVTVFTSNALNNEFNKLNFEKSYLPQAERMNGVKIRRFDLKNGLYSLLFRKIPKIRGGCRLRNVLFGDSLDILKRGPMLPQIILAIVRLKPDIVMGFSLCTAQAYFCYLAKKVGRFPLAFIPCIHANEKWSEDKIIYKIMKSADLIIALTDYEREFLVRKGIEARKISVVGVGIEPSKYNGSCGMAFRNKYNLKDEPIITFVGRNAKGKGIETLIDAMTIVWKDINNARLVLAGAKTSYTEILKNKILTLDIEQRNKIILVDNFREDEKSEIFSACDVFALPSLHESFGIVYLEAWIHNKPVIACRESASSSVVDDGKDGLLVGYGNKEELAYAIIRLLNNKKMRMDFGENGKEKVLKNYTWDIVANKIRTKYYEVANGRGKRFEN